MKYAHLKIEGDSSMTNKHELTFAADIFWTEGRSGELRSRGLPTLQIGAPVEFKGQGDAWTPEHLYVGSVASCFMLTLLSLAEYSKLELASLSIAANGKLASVDKSGYQITEVILTPTVVAARADDVHRVETLLVKAERSCFVTASIKSRVIVLPQVYHRQTPASPCPAVSGDSTEAKGTGATP
jgi:peroxiredoxin-like protein